VFETRHRLIGDLRQLEIGTVVAMEMAINALESAIAVVRDHDLQLAESLAANDKRIDDLYVRVNDGILQLLATQAPVATDLRTATSLISTIRCIERIGDQCVNIATVLPLSGTSPPRDDVLLLGIERLGDLALRCARTAHDALRSKSIELSEQACWNEAEADRLSRDILARAVEVGDVQDRREWAMHMVLCARALERIGRNARGVAAQVPFVVSGDASAPHPA
jgi:phosphate transport system protein